MHDRSATISAPPVAWQAGHLDARLARAIALLVPLRLPGIWLGARLLALIDAQPFRRMTLVFMILASAVVPLS